MQIPLSSPNAPSLAEVGGKAASLIRLSQAGFNVPPGIVLTTEFFRAWIDEIVASEHWRTVVGMVVENGAPQFDLAGRERVAEACDEVKVFAAGLPLDAERGAVIDSIRAELGEGVFAVRSSSPEEDLSGASFAGLYETVLGVSPEAFEEAVRTCFLSCLDSRVLLYKGEMRFEEVTPTIAVVVQRQVASDVAGVAFSINPLTNDFDETLINASWGLGEALVSGDVTPDSVVVDKVTGEVIETRLGDKGGERADEACLDTEKIRELTEAVSRIETLYGQPVDVEWAIASGELHIVQARPITTFIPLAKELQTAPGAQRVLYIDRAMQDGLTMSGPISPMTNDLFEYIVRKMVAYLLGTSEVDLDLGGVTIFRGSRIYMNVSNILHLLGKGEKAAAQIEPMNALMAEMFLSPELERYRLDKPPDFLRKRSLLWHVPRILWKNRSIVRACLKVRKFESFRAEYDRALRAFDAWATQPIDYSQPLDEFIDEALIEVGVVTMVATAPAIIAFIYGGSEAVKRVIDKDDPEQVALADDICRGYPNDIIVQMGLAMYDLAGALPASEFEDLGALAEKITSRAMPDAFLTLWDQLIERFGCRGPLEMELANSKYGEDPGLALRQIAMIAASKGPFNPHDIQRELIRNRERAYEKLLTLLSRRKQKRLAKSYRNIMRHYDSREMIKHHIMQMNERIRARLLHVAQELVGAGRLDHRDQVFELTLDDVYRALSDPAFDVREAAITGGAFYRELKRQVRHFPQAIDSRGRIFRPEKKREDGALGGAGVSPGVAIGPVKVLNDPFEKDIEAGDVLVAVTTDPGWTPLFINAAAVVLEIGGELQHGVLVAREYGKPCVAGIADVTTKLSDGQMVEVDGNAGTVRLVEDA